MRISQIPEIRKLMSRDYRVDVRRLNGLLNSRGDAGLQEVPPVPFTGDIDSMERGNCICLIGINPHFPALSRDAHKDEIAPTKKMVERFHNGDAGAYQEFIDSRLGYFKGKMANWVHYGSLGRGYAENFFPNEDHRSVWEKNAFAADILPYWSTDTRKISLSRFRKYIDKDPSFLLHQRMLSRMIEAIRPDMVHVNGISAGRLVDKLYCKEHPLKPWGDLGEEHNLMFGHASFGSIRVPVMAHNQFGQWGPKSKHWSEFANAWRQWQERYSIYGPCHDCGNGVWDDQGIDPRELPGQHEFTGYMLKPPIWHETGMNSFPPPRILCIKCAQNRIGRKLTIGDFMPIAMNYRSKGVIDYLFPDQNDRREWADEQLRLSWIDWKTYGHHSP